MAKFERGREIVFKKHWRGKETPGLKHNTLDATLKNESDTYIKGIKGFPVFGGVL